MSPSQLLRSVLTSASLWTIIGILPIGLVAYLSYTPRVDKDSPPFTKDTIPFIGSWGFYTRKWRFWRDCVKESKTGNFSFWLGKNHVIGLSGLSARKMYLENRSLDFYNGSNLVGMGPDYFLDNAVHEPGFAKSNQTYFQRRMLDLQKSEPLSNRLPAVVEDISKTFSRLAAELGKPVDPFSTCYRAVVSQSTRVFCTDEIANNSKLLDKLTDCLTLLLHNPTPQSIALPWLPSLAFMNRRRARWGMRRLVAPIVDQRLANRSVRANDSLQVLVDNGDEREHILNYLISILFIGAANASFVTSIVLKNLAGNSVWQERVHQEVVAAVETHAKNNTNGSLFDRLASLPLDAWESSFPSIELCSREAIRFWITFPMIRRNMAPHAVSIPDTGEVIPPGSFVCYHTSDVHFSEELFPEPKRFDPGRYTGDRQEFKKEPYSYLGWGHGLHPCLGIRWAKLQQNVVIAHAIAQFKWDLVEGSENLLSITPRGTS